MIWNVRQSCLAPAAAAAVALAFALSACSSTFDVLPEKMGGLPESAPARHAEPLPFPNVYEQRPTREAKPLDDSEQKKLETELTTLRDQQQKLANPPPPPAPAPAKKTAAAPKKDAAPPQKVAAPKEPPKKKQNEAVVPEQKGPVAVPKMIN